MRNLTSILVFLVLCGIFFPQTYAQKRKNQKQNSEKKVVQTEKNFIDGERYFLLEDYTKALGYFQKALETDSRNGTIHYKIAEVYLKEKDLSRAEVYAAEALKLDASKKYFYLLLADIKSRKAQYNQAASIYEEMLKNIPDTHMYLYDLAAIYVFNNQLDKALSAYNRAEKELGRNPEIYLERMKLYDRKGDFSKGNSEIESLITFYPKELSYRLIWINRLMTFKRFGEAEEMLERLNKEHPIDIDILLNLAELYQLQSKTKEYTAIVQELMAEKAVDFETKITLVSLLLEQRNGSEFFEDSMTLLNNLAEEYPKEYKVHLVYADHLYASGEKEKSLEEYILVTKYKSDIYEVWANILNILLELEDYERLNKYGDAALEIYPNQAYLYFIKGMAAYSTNNLEESQAYFEEALLLSKNDARLYERIQMSLAIIAYKQKDFKSCFKIYEQIIAKNPNNYEAINNYCFYSALQKSNLMRARTLGLQLVKAKPKNAHYLDTFGWVLYQLKEYKESKKYLEVAVAIAENNQSIIEHYGDVLFRLGQRDKAIVQWERAQKMATSERLEKKIAERKITDD